MSAIDPKAMLDLYREGMTDVEVMRALNISRKTFETAMDTSPQFRQLVQDGRDLAEAFWVSQPRLNLKNKDFMTELWKFYMANRYAWSTKSEQKTNELPLNADKAREELQRNAPALIKAGIIKLDDPDIIPLDTARKVLSRVD